MKNAPRNFQSKDSPTASTDNDDYWRCRRSIRCWPIRGPGSDLWGLTGDFFNNILAIPQSSLHQSSVESIRRLSTRKNNSRATRINNEVLVTFVDVATRDTVFSYASNLARFRSDPDPPGIRLEYPSFLTGAFRTLERYGLLMKAKFGPQLKRSIKFDDSSMSLLIDVLIPGDSTWTKVSLELARDAVEKEKAIETNRTRNRLDSLPGREQDQPSPVTPIASTSGLRESTTLREFNGPERPAARWGNK